MSIEESKSILEMERVSIEEIEYSRNVNVKFDNIDYQMNFSRQIMGSEDNNHFRVALTANLRSSGEEAIKLKVTIVGFFHCAINDAAMKQKLLENNAIAILFPYLRSQISLASTQTDMPPIVLPSMNIIKLFQDVDKQVDSNDE